MPEQRSFFDVEIQKDMAVKKGGKQPTPFDTQESQRMKVDGKARAAESQLSNLELARRIAEEIGRQQELVNADDVGELLWERHEIVTLGPAAGSLFCYGDWEFTGTRVISKRKKNHGRELKCYRLKLRDSS